MMKKYTEEEPLKVFTAFSGYDSQCLALKKAGIPFDLVGWSEIEKRAIDAHNLIFPEYKDRNYGNICQIDWNKIITSLGMQKGNRNQETQISYV